MPRAILPRGSISRRPPPSMPCGIPREKKLRINPNLPPRRGPGGAVKVRRVVYAVDCGRPVNPEGVRAQVESAAIYGLSATLHDAITIKGGRVEQSNFDDYQMPRMSETPKTEVHVVLSKEEPTGIGEPGLPVVVPAVCNAIFAATGKRIHRLPIRAEDLA